MCDAETRSTSGPHQPRGMSSSAVHSRANGGDAGAAFDDWASSAPWDEQFMDSSVVEGKRGGRFARIGFKETKVTKFKIEVRN